MFTCISLLVLVVCSALFVAAAPTPSGFQLPRPAYPLTVNGPNIVDSNGAIYQMRCANWPGHIDAMLPEGIQWASLDQIVSLIVSSGVFNCIRLTYAVEMFTVYNKTTARDRLTQLNLPQQIGAIQMHNPDLVDLTLIEVQSEVVAACDKQNVAVLFDNQVSKPEWCCSFTDGNGWFNDANFPVDQWLSSLRQIATLYSKQPNAVAFSLRNELRNNKKNRAQQVADWYEFVPQGMQALHQAKLSALIFVSGLNYDLDFSYLSEKHPLNAWDQAFVALSKNIVFEGHMYPFSGFNITSPCDSFLSQMKQAFGYPISQQRPLMMSELGLNVDSYPTIKNDAQYWTCLTQWLTENRLGFGIWLLGGSYLIRDSGANAPDSYGALDVQFTHYKSQTWLDDIKKADWTSSTASSVSSVTTEGSSLANDIAKLLQERRLSPNKA